MKLAIIHFNPLEQYPPAMNWVEYLEKKLGPEDEARLFTREAPPGMAEFRTGSASVRISRYPGSRGGGAVARYKNYFGFYLSVLRELRAFKPDTVLYYESLSALPALYYKYFVNRNCRLLAHYHEYTSPAEYKGGMALNYRSHLLEKRLYPRFSGISHTNRRRLELFTTDNPRAARTPQTVWPNYPPQSWLRTEPRPEFKTPLRFVYVGALSLETMYADAFARWILARNGEVTWDIYSWNITAETRQYLEPLAAAGIRLHEGVSYSALPAILQGFDIGVILYKGHIPNYVHNAPNKLFEYLSCGLDTWFPVQMTGAMPYVTDGTFPRVTAVDFEHLENLPADQTSHAGLRYLPSAYTSEAAAARYFGWMMNPVNPNQ